MKLKNTSKDTRTIIFLIVFIILILIGFGSFLFLIIKEPISEENSIYILNNNDRIPITVELATNDFERNRGLMNRTDLCENCGMLFIFPDEDYRTFWMKNTLIPLDIIFINEEKRIVNIEEDTKKNQTEELYSSESKAKYVLEVNSGFCQKNNIDIGNTLILDNMQI